MLPRPAAIPARWPARPLTCALLLAFALPTLPTRAEDGKPAVSSVRELDKAMLEKELQSYPQLDLKSLQTTLEKQRGKKVSFEAVFHGTYANPPDYMEKAGVRTERYSFLRFADQGFIVVARHTDDLDKAIAALKAKTKVRIYGEVQKFSVEPKGRHDPLYYIEAAHLRVVDDTPPTGKDKGKTPAGKGD